MTLVVDARGHQCPVPTLRLSRAMRLAGAETTLTLLATDPMARIDVPHLVKQLGGQVLSVTEAEGLLTIVVVTPAAPPD